MCAFPEIFQWLILYLHTLSLNTATALFRIDT